MNIVFEKIRAKNFLSIGDKFVEMSLNTHNITCVAGDNGSAKSALCIDAIYYAIYGKSFRKIPIAKMVNSINKKDMRVELEFRVNNNRYKIVRGKSKDIFEIYENDVLIPQNANKKDYQTYIDDIINIDEISFRQTTIIGSTSYIPFMQLDASKKRAFVEDLIGLKNFSIMAVEAKKEYDDLNNVLFELNKDLDIINVKIEQQKMYDTKKTEEYVNQIKDIDERLKQEYDAIDILEQKKQMVLETYDNELLEKANNNILSIEEKIKKCNELSTRFKTNININNKDIDFLSHNDSCPMCKRKFEDEYKDLKTKELIDINDTFNKNIDEINIKLNSYNESLEKNKTIIEVIKSKQLEILKIDKSIAVHNSKISELNRNRTIYEKRIKDNEKQYSNDIIKFEKEKEKKIIEIEDCNNKILGIQSLRNLLKDDGVKKHIIKTYIPIINKQIEHFLDIIGFDVKFELDEMFNETFKYYHRENFSYGNLSEGERGRVDFAVMMAFREISKLRNTVNTNLLLCDEFDHGTLDDSSMVSISNIFKSCNDMNIFIISHSTDYFTNISDRNIVCEKINGFSNIKEL